jgi:hypothetical protein
MVDDLTKALERLSGELPVPRIRLSESDKDALIALIGPRTVRNILRASKDFKVERIPFLFSTIDTQAVVDVLANDMTEALERAFSKISKKK